VVVVPNQPGKLPGGLGSLLIPRGRTGSTLKESETLFLLLEVDHESAC
jgi:hypothetical protein